MECSSYLNAKFIITGVWQPGNAKYPAYNTQRLDAVRFNIKTMIFKLKTTILC